MLVVFSFDSEFKIKKVIWIIKMLEIKFSIDVIIIKKKMSEYDRKNKFLIFIFIIQTLNTWRVFLGEN